MSTPTHPKFVLGTANKEFNSQTLRKLLYSAKNRQELSPAKKYLISYYARGETGVYKWMPKKQIFKYFLKKDACESFIQSDVITFKNDKGETTDKFDIRQWFFRDTPFFSLEVNPSQPKVYRDPSDNGFYINQFPGFLHLDPPPFNQFSQEIRDQCKLILNQIREVLSSSVEEQEYYMMNLVTRIAIGQKMQKSMFLYSGPGTGKTMITWFLRKMVLGPKITEKRNDEKIITGQFNKELEGKCLLVLEEMSNSKSTDWITFANRLKDFIDSDSLKIEEKHKTPYDVANITNIIINSNNSKTIRLDRNDRRYFIPDISEKYVENGIGMDHYYAPLDRAIKNPEVGKAFYSYALEYVKLNPDFDERKIPMTKTKLMMINRDNNVVHEFVKQAYVCESRDIEISSSNLYTSFKRWQSEQLIINNKKPPTVQEFTHALRGLGLEAKQKRVGDRKVGKRVQWYSASYRDLYTTFIKRNLIDEAENLDEPEGYQHKENKYIHPAEKFPEEVTQVSQPSITAVEEVKTEKNEKPEPPKVVAKKILPPLPPKPKGLKERVKSLKSESEIDPASIPLPESDIEEPYGIPGPSKTPHVEPSKPPEHVSKIRLTPLSGAQGDSGPTLYFDKRLESLYNSVKYYWESDLGGDPEEFDWEVFAIEIEDLSNCKAYNYEADPYHFSIRRAVQIYRNNVNGRDRVSYEYPTNAEIAQKIRKYANEERGQVQIKPQMGCKIVPVKKLAVVPNVNEMRATDEVYSDDDDGELLDLVNEMDVHT